MENDNHELHLKLYIQATKNRKPDILEKHAKKQIKAHIKYFKKEIK